MNEDRHRIAEQEARAAIEQAASAARLRARIEELAREQTLITEKMIARPPRTAVASLPAPKSGEVDVFFATDRKSNTTSLTNIRFTNARAEQLTLGTVRVSLPPGRKMGEMPKQAWWEILPADPKKHTIVGRKTLLGLSEYFQSVSEHMTKTGRKAAFVFVHGYNVSFDDAAARTAQMAVDLGVRSVPVFYSWPSQGVPTAYTADEANVEWTESNLRFFFELFADRTEAEDIIVVAHSMGTRAATRALAKVLERREDLRAKFKELVLS